MQDGYYWLIATFGSSPQVVHVVTNKDRQQFVLFCGLDSRLPLSKFREEFADGKISGPISVPSMFRGATPLWRSVSK